MRKTIVKLPVKGEEVEIFAPTVRILKMADNETGGNLAKSIKMIAACANKTPDEIEDLDALDYKTMEKAVEDFLKSAGVMA